MRLDAQKMHGEVISQSGWMPVRAQQKASPLQIVFMHLVIPCLVWTAEIGNVSFVHFLKNP
jgi:hypothetical protein